MNTAIGIDGEQTRGIHFGAFAHAKACQATNGGHVFAPHDRSDGYWFPATMTPSVVFSSPLLAGIGGILNPVSKG